MFCISDVKDTFNWPVKVQIPSGSNGKWVDRVFTGEFNLLGQDRVDEILAMTETDTDVNLSNEVLFGWGEDVKDSGGQTLGVNDENKSELLKIPYVRMAVVRAYFEAIGGRKARRGN